MQVDSCVCAQSDCAINHATVSIAEDDDPTVCPDMQNEEDGKLDPGSGKRVLLFRDLSVTRKLRGRRIAHSALYSVSGGSYVLDLLKSRFASVSDGSSPKGCKGVEIVLKNFTGIVEGGEICLVLGRPNSGHTTFLRTISLEHDGLGLRFVEGNLMLDGMDMKSLSRSVRAEFMYNSNTDIHMEFLTVEQTLNLASRFKFPKQVAPDSGGLSGYSELPSDSCIRNLGLERSRNTIIGNETIRGVSGGEKRRVSIAEMLLAPGVVSCWEGVTSGLDSGSAYKTIGCLKEIAKSLGKIAIVSLDQASDSIYSLFDKLVVIDGGQIIYFGPPNDAGAYFESLGYVRPPFVSTAEFLLGLLDLRTRIFNPTLDPRAIPTNAQELAEAFRVSPTYKSLIDKIAKYQTGYDEHTARARVAEFVRYVNGTKSKFSCKALPYSVSYPKQVALLVLRRLQILKNRRSGAITGVLVLIFTPITVGLVFFNSSSGSRLSGGRSGFIIISLVYCVVLQLVCIEEMRKDGSLVGKHKRYGFYSASAEKLAYFICAIPRIILTSLIYILITYSMIGFDLSDYSGCLTAFLNMVLLSMCTLSMFMLVMSVIKSFSVATKIAVSSTVTMVCFSGYIIRRKLLVGFFYYLSTINPLRCAYSNWYEAGGQLRSIVSECSKSDYVPNGPEYTDNRYGFCPKTYFSELSNSTGNPFAGDEIVNPSEGDDMVSNYLIIIIMMISFLLLTCVFARSHIDLKRSSPIYKNPSKREKILNDELSRRRKFTEDNMLKVQGLLPMNTSTSTQEDIILDIPGKGINLISAVDGDRPIGIGLSSDNTSLRGTTSADRLREALAWRDICYTIKSKNKDVVIIEGINGYVEPGRLLAIIGSSGAGKTTFLDVMCSMKTSGATSGEVTLGGKKFDASDRDRYAYCEQVCVLKSTHTVRETLRFSAYLRQDYNIPISEKDRDVEDIISLLELDLHADAIIGDPNTNTHVSPYIRKLVSIGVELAAKPGKILFLDEPTTQLDPRGAEEVVRQLRKLADIGMIVVCVLHQPSTIILEMVDYVFCMTRGGRTAYIGPTGKDSSIVLDYFQRRGAIYYPGASLSEFLIDVIDSVSKCANGNNIDWVKEWDESEEKKELVKVLELITIEGRRDKPVHDSHQFEHSVRTSKNGSEMKASNWGYRKDRKTDGLCTRTPVPWLYKLKVIVFREVMHLSRSPDYVRTRLINSIVLFILISASNIIIQDISGAGDIAGILSRFLTVTFTMVLVILITPQVLRRCAELKPLANRENSMGICSRVLTVMSTIISEIPLIVVCTVLYYLLGYLPYSKQGGPPVRAIMYTVGVLLLQIYSVTISVAISAIFPTLDICTKVLSALMLVFITANGTIVEYRSMSLIAQYLLHWANPGRWFMGSMLASGSEDIVLDCELIPAYVFSPPPNTTCGDYMKPYFDRINPGKILNPLSYSACVLCPVSSENDYLRTFGYFDKSFIYRDMAIYCVFIIVNIVIALLAAKYVEYTKR